MTDGRPLARVNTLLLSSFPSQSSGAISTSSNFTYETANSINPGIDSPNDSPLSFKLPYTTAHEENSSSGNGSSLFHASSSSVTSSSLRTDDSYIPETNPDEGPIILIIMGPTGTGKSNFIKAATGNDDVHVGHNLQSCTGEIQVFKCLDPFQGREFVLVDTPGFDDTYKSEAVILEKIASWLLKTYRDQRILSGVLYLHNIIDNRMTNTRLRSLDIFQKICGKSAYSSVGLITTHWDVVPALDVASRKEAELHSDYWEVLIEAGAKTGRFDNTHSSAWTVINSLSLKSRLLQIQEEMGKKNRPLSKTKAGRGLYSWLDRAAQSLRNVLKRLGMMKRNGSSESARKVQQELEEEMTKASQRLRDIQGQQALLRTY